MRAHKTIATLVVTGVMTFSLLAQPMTAWAAGPTDVQQMTAFTQEQKKEDSCKVYVDGKEINQSKAPIVDASDIYLVARDIFSVFGYKTSWDSQTKLASFVSTSNFFTVDTFTTAVKLNGVKVDVAVKIVGGTTYVKATDLNKIIPVKVSVSVKNREVEVTSDFKSGIVVRVDNTRVLTLAGSYSYSNGTLFVGASTLEHMLPDSKIEFTNDFISISSPMDGSFTKFGFDGTVEYSPSGSNEVKKEKVALSSLFSGEGVNRRINVSQVQKYSSYNITISTSGGKTSVEVISGWYGVDVGDDILVLNEAVPLGTAPLPVSAVYSAPTTETNAVVRDTGYIMNVSLQDEIAKEINLYRSNANLSVLAVNHTLVYKTQNKVTNRTTVFDNLRWCRENLSNRSLEHCTLTVGFGEILMQNANSSATAPKLVNTWYNSPGHRAIMMDPNATEFGILVIQYPNGDVDIAGIFIMK